MIIPSKFLKTIQRSGLGKNLFDEMRYTPDGAEIPDFVLNQPAWRSAQILVAGDNFRLRLKPRTRALGAPRLRHPLRHLHQLADIFYNNCFKNGILPVVLPPEAVAHLMDDARKGANARITIDLAAQTVTASDGTAFAFDVDPFKKHCL